MPTVRGVTVTAYALSVLSGISALLCLLMIMQTPAHGRHRGCPPAPIMYTRDMETATERFTINVINPNCVAIEDATLADRPHWRKRVAVMAGHDALLAVTTELARINATMALDPATPIDRCVSKVGEPYAMRECGRALIYRDGWRHLDDAVNAGHWGFPRREV